MIFFLHTLSIAFLAASVSGQACVEETLNCNDPVPTIYKLGDASCPCNSLAHAGALKFSNNKIYVCLGSEWKILQFEAAYGTVENPGSSCKDILDKAGQQLNDGVYWIQLQGSTQSFPVYCDMASGGWTMVFKIVSGVNNRVWELYSSSNTSAENVTAALDVTNQHLDHYKNRVIMNWGTFNPSQARVTLYVGGNSVKELMFNAAGTDKLNWFSLDKMTSSSWTDISTEPRNFFSIQGDCHPESVCRSFLINRSYGGCGIDKGWLIGIPSNTWCSWETTSAHRDSILYSKLSTHTNWNTDANVGVADVLAVFLK